MAASPVVLYRNINNTDTVKNENYYVDDHFPSIETLGWSNDGFIFKEWNSSRDGTGTAKNVGDIITESWPSNWFVIWESVPSIDYIVTNTELTDIADAIRIKAEISGSLIFPSGFISAISNIPRGGAEEKQINFIDYDGTILYSYTKTEINAMSSENDLPKNPSHENLTAQGWNWTLSQIKAQLTAIPDGQIFVGQMYITSSGKTEIDVSFADDTLLSPILTIAVNGTVVIDWGDNTATSSVTGTSLTTRQSPSHTYGRIGDYTISISVGTGTTFSFYCAAGYPILRKNTTTTGNYAFTNCVKHIRLGNGITSLASMAFQYCRSLETVIIPKGITTIGASAFGFCYALKSVVIPNTVRGASNTGGSMFNECCNLRTISFQGNMAVLSATIFAECRSLKSVPLPISITDIGLQAFQKCYSLKTMTIPNGVSSIGANTFEDCKSLKSISIPNSVTSIGNSAFSGCLLLTIVNISSYVTNLGNSVFKNCYSVKEYHFKATSPPTLGTTAFSGIASDCVIYVPYSADHSILNSYKTTTNWSSYASYIQEESQ